LVLAGHAGLAGIDLGLGLGLGLGLASLWQLLAASLSLRRANPNVAARGTGRGGAAAVLVANRGGASSRRPGRHGRRRRRRRWRRGDQRSVSGRSRPNRGGRKLGRALAHGCGMQGVGGRLTTVHVAGLEGRVPEKFEKFEKTAPQGPHSTSTKQKRRKNTCAAVRICCRSPWQQAEKQGFVYVDTNEPKNTLS